MLEKVLMIHWNFINALAVVKCHLVTCYLCTTFYGGSREARLKTKKWVMFALGCTLMFLLEIGASYYEALSFLGECLENASSTGVFRWMMYSKAFRDQGPYLWCSTGNSIDFFIKCLVEFNPSWPAYWHCSPQ